MTKRLIDRGLEDFAISPIQEMGAYEALWDNKNASFKKLAQMHQEHPNTLPSDFVPLKKRQEYADHVRKRFAEAKISYGVRIHGDNEYPMRLRDATYPVELFYYQGWWDLAASRCVAVVGTRNPTHEGVLRTRRLVRDLVKDNFTIVSGLAAGIDRIVHQTAIEEGGRTIAILGTPLSYTYPKENAELQVQIANHFLVISQVPVKRYESQDYRFNRFFFPERNITMSAFTEATIIVEAGETSGTLIQARAAIQQKRVLFILDNCFRNSRLTWPIKFNKKGAIRVRDYDDIRQHLPS